MISEGSCDTEDWSNDADEKNQKPRRSAPTPLRSLCQKRKNKLKSLL